MNQSEYLERLSKILAEQTGVSMEEAGSIINGAISVFETMRNALTRIYDQIKEFFESFQQNAMKKESKPVYRINWDTRRKSQVIDNRPAFAVRKVIGR